MPATRIPKRSSRAVCTVFVGRDFALACRRVCLYKRLPRSPFYYYYYHHDGRNAFSTRTFHTSPRVLHVRRIPHDERKYSISIDRTLRTMCTYAVEIIFAFNTGNCNVYSITVCDRKTRHFQCFDDNAFKKIDNCGCSR